MPNTKISLGQLQSELANAGDPWEAGVTSVSVLSLDEQLLRLGVTPPAGELTSDQIAAQAEAMESVIRQEALSAIQAPAAYDLRNVGGRNFVTKVKDQKSCGSCVAFGAVATVESALRVQRGDPNLAIDLSEAHLFFCHARARGFNCNTGWWPEQAFEDFKSKGVVDDACYPYDLSKTQCNGLCSDAASRVLKISGFQDLTNKPAQIKEWVSTKGPVCACFVVYDDFFNYKSGIYKHVSGANRGGHCVTIVGYQDNPGYWICKNSWGEGWGDKGFFNIAYGQCGIESWRNHGVAGIVNTGWQRNKRVTGLWVINQNRNAWAHIQGLGWRTISPDNDNILLNMLVQLTAAKAAGRPVTFYEEQSVIKQVYVL
jgi:C1A family cysteine protease